MTAGVIGRAFCALVLIALVGAGCATSTADSKIFYIATGQLPVSERPTGHDRGIVAAMATTTIPLAQQNPLSALFQSMSVFQSCLSGLGTSFIGIPDGKDPHAPVNDPTYLKNLQTCAAQSQILQALKEIQNSQNKLTPAQINKQNKQYIAWRFCMIGKGWQIPAPTPDSHGRLFNMSATGGTGMVPPSGQSILSSGDMEACANKIATAGSPNSGG